MGGKNDGARTLLQKKNDEAVAARMKLTMSDFLFSINTYAALTSHSNGWIMKERNGTELADQLSSKLVRDY